MSALDAILQRPAPALSRPAAERASADPRPGPAFPPDFAALAAAGLPPGPLLAAQAEADRAGVSPFDALLASGAVGENDLVGALARALGVRTMSAEDLDGPGIDAETFALGMRTGAIHLRDGKGRLSLVIAARGASPARLAASRRGKPANRRIMLAGPRAFADLMVARAGRALAARASEGPSRLHPKLTVEGGLPKIAPWLRATLLAAASACVAGVFVSETARLVAITASGLAFAILNLFRLLLACTPESDATVVPRRADRDLPVYTVLVALAKEGAVVPSLLDALEALDYPAAKLDIKLLVEDWDRETLAAIAARPPRAGVEVLVLPQGGPKTKPRALNAGLLAARGRYLTVFDAEDRPDPRQLRIAVEAFRNGDRDLACVQARLAIDNHADGWFARQFAIEYAALFDVVLPALATLRLPIALGGTSNHFSTSALRTVGGWDAANVTEDADLGLRLARLGWRTATIASTTYEEAPARLWPWIKQRTRWMKGFMVTSVVHGRAVGGLAKKLDPLSFAASLLLIGGVAVTALAYPLVLLLFLWQGLVTGSLLAPSPTLAGAAFAGLHVANMIVGFAAGLACGWMGIDRRGSARLAADLITMPFYWILVGIAAWRALLQIAFGEASRWEKTAHGVSRQRRTPAHM